MRPLLFASACALLLSACVEPKKVVLRFQGEPADALVTIDDRYVGKLGRLARTGVRLEPGRYRVTVEQVGFFPEDQLVEVGEQQPVTVKIELTPVPD